MLSNIASMPVCVGQSRGRSVTRAPRSTNAPHASTHLHRVLGSNDGGDDGLGKGSRILHMQPSERGDEPSAVKSPGAQGATVAHPHAP